MDQVEAKRKEDKFRKEYDAAFLAMVKDQYKDSPQVVMGSASIVRDFDRAYKFLPDYEKRIEYAESYMDKLAAEVKLFRSIQRDLEAGEQI